MTHDVVVVEGEGGDPAFPLVRIVEAQGCRVVSLSSVEAALALVGSTTPDLVVLDPDALEVPAPYADGLDVCRELRSEGYEGGLVLVSVRAGEVDVVAGLDAGADDYLAKPLRLAEFQARVRALLRRSAMGAHRADDVVAGGLHIDTSARRVAAQGREVVLTPKEFDVLLLLVTQQGRTVSRDTIMKRVWDPQWFGSTKTLDATMGRLRAKLDAAAAAVRIVAVRGVGFRLEGD